MISKEFSCSDPSEAWMDAGKWLGSSGVDESKCRIYGVTNRSVFSCMYSVHIEYAEEVSFSVLMDLLDTGRAYLTHPDRCDYYFEGDIDGHSYSLYIKKF